MVIHPKSKPKEEDILCTFCMSSIHYNEEYCKSCKRYLELGTTVKGHEKELRIKSLLDEEEVKYVHDKVIKGGNSLRRPDFRLFTSHEDMEMILEVDEDKHRGNDYTCECELKRMKEIFQECKKPKMLFIRYNPDKYKSTDGVKKFTPVHREKYLMKYINNKIAKPIEEDGLYVVYLFYDGFLPNNPEIEKIM